MVNIRLANEDDLPDVLAVLNEVTLNLHRKGIQQWSFPWEEKDVNQDILASFTYVVSLDEKIIGTFTIRNVSALHYVNLTKLGKELCQIAISPEYQGKDIGRNVIGFARSYAKRWNLSIYLDCWAGNETLKAFYSKNGFKYLGDFPEHNYCISAFQYN